MAYSEYQAERLRRIFIQKGVSKYAPVCVLLILISCQPRDSSQPVYELNADVQPVSAPYVMVLGTIQDAGSPHIGCTSECCRDLFSRPDPERQVVALGLVDQAEKKVFLIEATPDMPRQLEALRKETGFMELPDGIFLTHAHIGH